MKTNYLKNAMNVCILVCAVCFLTSGNIVKSQTLKQKYYYDSSREDALKPTQTIYQPDQSGNYLVPHLKYYFTYDEAGRVVKKEAHRWNRESKSWKQSYMLNITYEESCITVDYAAWSKKEDIYALNRERAVYTLHNEALVAYACFKQSQYNGEWVLVVDMNVLQIDPMSIMNDNLFANR